MIANMTNEFILFGAFFMKKVCMYVKKYNIWRTQMVVLNR